MEKVIIESQRCDWQSVEPFVAMATSGDVLIYDAIREKVERDEAAAYLLISPYDGRAVAGFVVTVTPEKFVSVEAAGAAPGWDMVNRIMPEIERVAAETGARGVEVYTYRKGMIEVLAKRGWATAYVKMAKVFNE